MLSELAFCELDSLYRNVDKGAVEGERAGAEGRDCKVCYRKVLCPGLRFEEFYDQFSAGLFFTVVY